MLELLQFVRSDSAEARIWRALLPAVALATWFLGGLVVYSVRCLFWGEYRDEDIEAKGQTRLLGMWIRRYFVWVTRLLWRAVEATGIPANAVTTLGALLALGSGVGFAAGRFALGGWLYIFSGILDVFDGRLARRQSKSSEAGAVLDSILDRYGDAAVLSGLCWFYRDSWVLLPALLSLAGGFLVSYVRARGESVGVKVRGGLMQRPERIVYLGVATALSPIAAALMAPDNPAAPHWLAIAGICFLAISTQVSAVQRVAFLLEALSPARPAVITTRRGGLPRSVLSAALATASDFALVTVLVGRLDSPVGVATALGCVLGAVVSFNLGRHFAFPPSGDGVTVQAGRYAFASASSALLNTGGVVLLLMLPSMDYRIAWLVVRAAVFVLWNFPLHRDYVFRSTRSERKGSCTLSAAHTGAAQ
jgi:phosphatidylglycerophosphate synthase/putative flippase GtrA